jgi:hypothetical protein
VREYIDQRSAREREVLATARVLVLAPAEKAAVDEKAGAAAKSEFIRDRAALTKAKEAGWPCAEARAAGYSCADAKAVGYDLIDAKAAGWTTEDLLNAGYINKALAMRLDAANSEAAKI